MSKVVLITGASKGIGKVVADYLHQQDYQVYGTSRNPTTNNDYKMLELDVTDQDSVSTCVNEVMNDTSRIDVLVNNAGFAIVGGISDVSVDDLISQFDTNLYGVHRMVREVLPHFRSCGEGMIINMGSFGGRLSVPYQALYSASKAALAMYSDGLRMELMRENIVITLIEPGDTKTDFDAGRIKGSDYGEDEITDRAINIMKEAEQKGADPDAIAKLIHKIIKTNKVKPRYTTGLDATILGVLQRFVPFSIQERLIMKNYKVPRK